MKYGLINSAKVCIMAKIKRVYVCQTWKEQPHLYPNKHVFQDGTDDGFCPELPPYHGILLPEDVEPELAISITYPDKENQEFEEGNSIIISTDLYPETDVSKVEFYVDDIKIGEDLSHPFTFNYYAVKGKHSVHAKVFTNQNQSAISSKVKILVTGVSIPEVGLSVILMDASASMAEVAYKESPIIKMKLVAITAASGIFDLERLHNNPNALVAAFKFDDRVELMFMDTVANLITRFNKDVTAFANFIYEELEMMQQDTDINQALSQAHIFVDKFLKKQLDGLPVSKYRVMMQSILKYGSVEAISIPNIRILIYTDGMQFDSNKGTILRPNPFSQYPLEGLNHDIVIGAFFGQESDKGCKELQNILNRCPIHDELQFFLFDNPAKIGNLKYLFRMASGASGFCPKCLEKEMFK